MIAGLDSSFDRPDPGTAAAARAAGVRVWGGYIATRAGVGLAAPWSQADFDVVRNAGLTPIGFCSGRDDPVAIRDLARAWGVLPCLDVESGIREDGPWVQPWLDASGAGLYGNTVVHRGRSAPFYVVAWYGVQPPACTDPGLTWPWWEAAPAAPHGWQFCGTHIEFGLSVDRGWYDDWFAGALSGGQVGEVPVTGSEKLAFVRLGYNAFLWRVPSQGEETQWAGSIADDGSNLDVVLAQIEDSAEGNAVKDARTKLLQYVAGNAFPGGPGAVVPHTHPFTGTTGSS